MSLSEDEMKDSAAEPETAAAEETAETGTAPEPEAPAAEAEKPAEMQPVFYLITDDVTLESGDEALSAVLHAGDVVRVTDGQFEINGTPAPVPLSAGIAEQLRANGEETDEAFYFRNTVHDITPEQAASKVSAETEPEKEPEKPEEAYTAKQLLEDALDLIESVMASVFVVMMLFTFVFCVATVEGDSMIPTLTSNDRLMVNRISKSYDNGDILILNSKTSYIMNKETGEFYERTGLGKRIVKRLIAQGGEEVNIDFEAGVVYVNGTALDEPYVNTLTKRDSGAFSYPFTVPEGYVFVLGDNRNVSRDSRHPDVGLVPVDDIIGSVVIRLTPFNKFGKVDH